MNSNNFIINKDFKPISNNLINSSYWVHKNYQLDDNGLTIDSDFSTISKSKTNVDYVEEIDLNEDEENFNFDDDSLNYKEELSDTENLRNNTITKETPTWKGVLCFPFDILYSCIVMKSQIWPGAFAVAYKSYVI